MPQPPAKLTAAQRRRRFLLRRTLGGALAVIIVLGIIALDRSGLLPSRPTGTTRSQRSDLTDTQRRQLAPEDIERYDGKHFRVTYVVDGDTLDIACPDGLDDTTRIRFWGVDTPETVKQDTPVQHYGPEASALTKKLTLGKTVTLELVESNTRGNHGRLLAYIILPDGRMLNRVLLDTGHAYADPRYAHPRKQEFIDAMDAARHARRGLWAHATDSDLPYYLRDE
jgi:endonuclease YncB( thermonuclease family)